MSQCFTAGPTMDLAAGSGSVAGMGSSMGSMEGGGLTGSGQDSV